MTTMNPEVQPRLINATELATILSIGERTLWRLLAQGQLIKPVRIGGATRWRVEEVENWIADGCPHPNQRDNGT